MEKYIQTPCILLAVGYCKSGKSYSVKYTIKTIKRFDFVIVISTTAEFNNEYEYLKEMGISSRIYNTSKLNETMQKMMEIQNNAIKSGKKPNICLILDDCMGALKNNSTFQRLISCYRHYNISIFILTQYCVSQATFVRELCNYVYIFNQRTERSKKIVYENFFNDIESYEAFKKKFAELKEYEFFFIDRVNQERFIMKCPSDKPAVVEIDKKKFIEQFK
jgi:hypothetical protein